MIFLHNITNNGLNIIYYNAKKEWKSYRKKLYFKEKVVHLLSNYFNFCHMKKHFIFFTVMLLVITNCSNNNNEEEQPFEPKMVFVEGGTFTLGCADNDNDCYDDDKPEHQVTLNSFYIGKYEVTQGQWEAVMGNNPSWNANKGVNNPVDHVSWNDVQEYFIKLNELTGKNYRLPTEAEWEYAARGGNKSKGFTFSGSNNIDEIGWYGSHYSPPSNNTGTIKEYRTQPVGKKKPNELGIYDMSGNVKEWCSDWYDLYTSSEKTNPIGPATPIYPYRVHRGGACNTYSYFCRVTKRNGDRPEKRDYNLGFRIVLP